jgi:hypothetical protein
VQSRANFRQSLIKINGVTEIFEIDLRGI